MLDITNCLLLSIKPNLIQNHFKIAGNCLLLNLLFFYSMFPLILSIVCYQIQTENNLAVL